MQDQVELIRRIERQYLRDHLSALHLQMVDGMVIHLLFRRGPLRQEDIAQWIVADKGAVARSLAGGNGVGGADRQRPMPPGKAGRADSCRRADRFPDPPGAAKLGPDPVSGLLPGRACPV